MNLFQFHSLNRSPRFWNVLKWMPATFNEMNSLWTCATCNLCTKICSTCNKQKNLQSFLFSLFFRPLNSILKEKKNIDKNSLFSWRNRKCSTQSRIRLYLVFFFHSTWSAAPLTFFNFMIFAVFSLIRSNAFKLLRRTRTLHHVLSIGKCEILKYRAMHKLGKQWIKK